jgi:acyl transferase domain-containing protein
MRLEWVEEGKLLDAAYWPYNLRHTVRFSEAIGALYGQGYRVFVEIGPTPILAGMGSQCVPPGEGVWLPSLRQDRNDWEQMLETLGTMYVHGVNPDWSRLDKDHPRRRLPLPTYAFQRERYAIERAPRESRDNRTVDIRMLSGSRRLQTLAQAGRSLRAEWSESPNESGGIGVVRLLDERNEVVAEITGFPQPSSPSRSNESENRAELDDWLYKVEWEPQTLAQENGASSRGNVSARKWLIFADSHGVGASLASSLRERGDECVVVLAEGGVADSTGAVFTVDPTRADQVQSVVQKIAQVQGSSSWDGILHFWSLDCPASEHLSVEALAKAQFRSCGSILLLIQSLKEMTTTQPPRLWLVTQGVQPAGPRPGLTEVAQAPVRGLCRVIAMEHPELRCVGVDLDPVDRDGNVSLLLQEIRSVTGENQVAFRRGVRYVARLRRATFRTAPDSQGFRQDGTYLITGGLGDLGMKVARWMAHAGAGQLVLMGRHAASTQVEDLLRELQPAEVLLYEGDVARREDVAALFSQIQATMPPLRGIIHAAGVWEGGVLLQQDWNRFFEVLAPKVQGAWNLHELTQSLALDFFVSFSSGASVLGAAGLGDYASANSFLDALAHYRQAKGLPGSSINWGPWAGLGMVRSVTDLDSQRWSEHGMGLIPPELALYALAQVIRQDTPQISVLPINWVKLRSGIPALAESTFIRELAVEGAKPEPESAAKPANKTLIAELLLVKDPVEQRQILAGKLQGQAARVLRLPLPTLDVNRPLNQFGLDSLMALELRNRMQAEWGIAIPLATILGGPSILQLATLAIAKLDGVAAHADRVPPDEGSFASGRAADTIAKQEAQEILRKLPELSDDDVDSILRRLVRP